MPFWVSNRFWPGSGLVLSLGPGFTVLALGPGFRPIFIHSFNNVVVMRQCFILFSSFPLLLAFIVGGLGFEFCVFVAGWRHALRSEWPFIIIIIIVLKAVYYLYDQ